MFSAIRVARPVAANVMMASRVVAVAPRVAARVATPVVRTTGRRVLSTSTRTLPPSSTTSIWARPVTRIVIGGAASFGILALSAYGATRAGEEADALKSAMAGIEDSFYPDYVRTRLRHTFTAFGGGIAFTALAGFGALQSGLVMRMATMNPTMVMIGSMVATIGSMTLCRSISKENTFAKLSSMGLFNLAIGVTLAPVGLLGGPIVLRAAMYTGAIVGGLSLVAANAPSDRFLNWGGALGMGLGALIIASFGGALIPAAAPLLHKVSLYGGLGLFSAFILYDTQRIIAHAKVLPDEHFDPVNESISVYMDAVNIFIRIAMILSGSKKK